MILHKKSTVYYPQANGQAESTNKILIRIIRKVVSKNKTDWNEKLDSALWAFRTAFKVATGMTPFKLVYGLEAVVPMEFLVPSLRIAVRAVISTVKKRSIVAVRRGQNPKSVCFRIDSSKKTSLGQQEYQI